MTPSCLLPPALQYLGHVEVEESRGMHICEDAVKRLKTVSFTRKPPVLPGTLSLDTRLPASLLLFLSLPAVLFWATSVSLTGLFSMQFLFICHSQASSTLTGPTHLDPVLTSTIVGGRSHGPSSPWFTVPARGDMSACTSCKFQRAQGASPPSCCHLFGRATPRS